MGKCNIDHTLEDVKKKLQEQFEYIPVHLAEKLEQHLTKSLNQETLNEVFHLLKKYDLATEEERELRNKQFETLFA